MRCVNRCNIVFESVCSLCETVAVVGGHIKISLDVTIAGAVGHISGGVPEDASGCPGGMTSFTACENRFKLVSECRL